MLGIGWIKRRFAWMMDVAPDATDDERRLARARRAELEDPQRAALRALKDEMARPPSRGPFF